MRRCNRRRIAHLMASTHESGVYWWREERGARFRPFSRPVRRLVLADTDDGGVCVSIDTWTAVIMNDCVRVQWTAYTNGGERTHAVLDLPSGFGLLRVVTEGISHHRPMGRPACGGISSMGGMDMCVLGGSDGCVSMAHDCYAMSDEYTSEPETVSYTHLTLPTKA